MNKLSTTLPVLVALLLAALFFSACATKQLNISDNLSPSELIQRAQEASDRNRYNNALQYYQALLDRNATNIDLVCTAEYEIAFIHYKQKKYSQSREEFNALLERYDAFDGEYLPSQFKLLSKKVLERIDEKESSRSIFSRKK